MAELLQSELFPGEVDYKYLYSELRKDYATSKDHLDELKLQISKLKIRLDSIMNCSEKRCFLCNRCIAAADYRGTKLGPQ